MRYIYYAIALIFASVLTFCTGEREAATESIQNSNVAMSLSEDAIFLEDSITYAVSVVTDLQKNEGRKYFLRAMDLLVNQQKAAESIPLFKEAIRYFPDARMFFFLTKAYIETNNADNALKSNHLCYMLNYETYYELPFNDALIAALRKDTAGCINSLNEAIQEGFLNKNRIVDDKRFDFIRDNDHYVSMIVNTFNDDAKLKALLFKNYLKSIPDLMLPYTEPIDSVGNHNFDHYINYDYASFIPDMENGRFSRDVTNEYLYVGKWELENNFHAVVYKSYLAIADTLNPVKTYVITYDSTGTIVGNEMIGCYCSPMSAQAYTIGKDNLIETTPYTYTWKNDPLEKGYAGNQVISFEIEKVIQIHVAEQGVLKRESVANAAPQSAKEGG